MDVVRLGRGIAGNALFLRLEEEGGSGRIRILGSRQLNMPSEPELEVNLFKSTEEAYPLNYQRENYFYLIEVYLRN